MNKNIFIRLTIINSILLVALFLLIITTKYSLFTEENITYAKKMNFLFNNWNKQPIKDIILAQYVCPKNYYPLQLGETEKINIYNNKESILRPPFKLYTYRNSLICVKRLNLNYLSINSDNCKYICGYKDLAGNYMCAETKEDCPITNIFIIDINKSTPANYIKLNFFDNKKSLVYTKTKNKSNNNITVVGLKLTLGDYCSHPLEKGLDMNYLSKNSGINTDLQNIIFDYKYFNGCKTSINGYNINPLTDWLDSDYGAKIVPDIIHNPNNIMKKIYYKNYINTKDIRDSIYNKKLSKYNYIISGFPYKEIYYDKPLYNLYTEYYSGISQSCFSLINNNFNKLIPYSFKDINVGILAINSLLILTNIVYYIFDIGNIKNIRKNNLVTVYYILYFIIGIISVTISWIFYKNYIYNFYTLNVYFALQNNNNGLSLIKCFDSFTAKLISFIFNYYSAYYVIYTFNCILITILFFCFIFNIITFKCIRKLFKINADNENA